MAMESFLCLWWSAGDSDGQPESWGTDDERKNLWGLNITHSAPSFLKSISCIFSFGTPPVPFSFSSPANIRAIWPRHASWLYTGRLYRPLEFALRSFYCWVDGDGQPYSEKMKYVVNWLHWAMYLMKYSCIRLKDRRGFMQPTKSC